VRDKSNDDSRGVPKRLKQWIQGARSRGSKYIKKPTLKNIRGSFRGLPKKLQNIELDLRKVDLKNVSQHEGWIRLGLIVLAVFLLSEVTARVIGLFIRPVYPNLPQKTASMSGTSNQPTEDYESILRRNIFNVEGTIPDPFDQGLLDCFSQAKPSAQRMSLLGTIVMGDEKSSVALVMEEGGTQKLGVRKGETFFGKYEAMKVERKKLCFQVKATQDMEYIEIPEDNSGLGVSSPSFSGMSGEGIQPVSETEFAVKKDFLDKQLLNLNDILQTARAVPYIDQGSGKFRGFLIQSIDAQSPFAQLGIKQGDILTGVNDIVLDNAGKGLEAFQRLRSAPTVDLKVIRGGQETSLNYKVK